MFLGTCSCGIDIFLSAGVDTGIRILHGNLVLSLLLDSTIKYYQYIDSDQLAYMLLSTAFERLERLSDGCTIDWDISSVYD